jgi:glycosyltransferase involved in cell wall biosynthesis
MRVCFISTGLNPGGAETALAALVLGLAEAGVQALVVALRGAGRLVERLRERQISVTSLGVEGIASLSAVLPRIVSDVRSFRPDLVQGWMYHGNLVATAIAPLCGAPLLWGVRQALGAPERESAATNRLIRVAATLSRRPVCIIYNSERARADHEAIGYSSMHGTVIDNGFDTETLKPDGAARARWRSELGFAEDTILVGHLARYHPVKDHATFLRAAAEVHRRARGVRFLMAGQDVENSNRELVATIRGLGVERAVALLGPVDNVASVLPAFDIACVSSRSEGFPNVLGEAMSCGVPCVSTDVGDAARIIGPTGRVVPVGDSAQLAGAVLALALDPGQRSQLGTEARRRVVELFSRRVMTDRYARLYADCAEH